MPGSAGAGGNTEHRLVRLLDIGAALTSELDLPTILDLVLATARELTGARYAAIGVLDPHRLSLERFITAGMDEATQAAIGDRPQGHGLLGMLIDRPEAIRLHDVSEHPRSYGFPPGHPPMRSFLGAPIAIRGQAWGNLYLTEKSGAQDFDDDDLDTAQVLARWAAVAIDNARLFAEAEARRLELERAVHALRTTMDIAMAVGDETDLPRNLTLMVERGRELVDADALLIWLLADDELQIAAVSGNAEVPPGSVIPLGGSTAGRTIERGRSIRLENARDLLVDPGEYGMSGASSTLVVPLMHRGRGLGVLMAFGAEHADHSFDADAQRALEAFAVSAATAVAIAHSVEARRLHDTLRAAEDERRRWARELHDETLQGLAGLKLSLALALKAEPADGRRLVEEAVQLLVSDIAGLRGIIADLRPPTLDELGLEPALRALVKRMAESAGLTARVTIDLGPARLGGDVETIAYRVAQEALTNVGRHAGAHSVVVDLRRIGHNLARLTVEDDGVGLPAHTRATPSGREHYGIVGMRERAALGGGTLAIASLPGGGTLITLELPIS